ncbi:MAG: S1 RNA-binding domain-containing protein [Lachnospiraceae bacterium]|nr:S1 RNA-binding domain-containing protein [Lachnospiraceae bacterium]
METMDDFSRELENSLRVLKEGDLVNCIVTGVSESEVSVDFNYMAPGIIRALDYSGDPRFSIKNDVKVGDEITAAVLRSDDGRGNVLLSRRQAVEELAWADFKKMLDDETVVEVKIAEAVKGGVVTYLNGVRAFIPASQLALDYVEDLTTFVGQTVPARVITADADKRRLVLSSRDVLKERREAERASFVSNIQPGLVTEGTVQSLQPYGAFVSLGNGVDGLVHISQISSTKRLKHPSDELEVGQTVKVKVTAIKDGRISLSIKALAESDAPVEAVEEEKVEIPKSEELTTSLAGLLSGFKLN